MSLLESIPNMENVYMDSEISRTSSTDTTMWPVKEQGIQVHNCSLVSRNKHAKENGAQCKKFWVLNRV